MGQVAQNNIWITLKTSNKFKYKEETILIFLIILILVIG